jgi:hypothetical protein
MIDEKLIEKKRIYLMQLFHLLEHNHVIVQVMLDEIEID